MCIGYAIAMQKPSKVSQKVSQNCVQVNFSKGEHRIGFKFGVFC